MSESRYASLSSGLLARKGAAKPAMRPQAFGHVGPSGIEDLGWNDMGFAAAEAGDEPLPEHVPSSIAALTPAPKHSARSEPEPEDEPEAEEAPAVEAEAAPEAPEAPPVAAQQRAIAESFGAEEAAEPEPQPLQRAVRADVVPLPKRGPATAPGRKAAFTLRLDADRHLRLRLACAVSGRSAQQFVTAALDSALAAMPELDDLAGRVPAKAGAAGATRN